MKYAGVLGTLFKIPFQRAFIVTWHRSSKRSGIGVLFDH